MAPEYDVAIVGSGPAGAACALGLARLGIAVALIDERVFPRTKACGEYLNSGAVNELRELGLGATLALHATPLRGMRLTAHDELAEFRFAQEAWSMPRRTLDDAIRSAALQAGARAVRGRFRTLRQNDDSVMITVAIDDDESHEIRARYLIGADGMRSAVARACTLWVPSRGERYATGGHYRGVALDRWIEMYASPLGYLALNPLDADVANVMFVVSRAQLLQSRGALSTELARFSR
ncbi:MAG: NAD(P)/FAD-dependent oxidoreductase, partial [Vulcanimicrobiaceae bacterium]